MALTDLGFTPLAERVYRALLDNPELDVAALSSALACEAGELAAALTALAELEVATPDDGAPAGVTLKYPASALGELIERREDELLNLQRKVGDTRAEVAKLTERYSARPWSVDPATGLERIEDLDQVRQRLSELAFFTRRSVWSVQPGASISRSAIEASKPLDLRGLRRGIAVRTIYNTGALDDEVFLDYVQEVTAAGAEIRVTDDPIERMVIMDDVVAVLPIDPQNSGQGALIVRQPGLIVGFLRLFHRLWNEASVYPPPKPDAGGPSGEDRKVLALLAEGSTDEVAARVIGVSVRHLRRRVARLMTELGAGSRFEAGVEAARRGWI
ncbi:hypothetical protein SD37_21560 [Amycolatopsis orientalis]|uniref:HTH luxR-type domain-containing protein n=1 Tax=Amycolatopsis orientalis TaxID=31958 RepID=A0A193C0N3_AMYOR|nr:hypothetical protein [Amycolatopsis orientalis]ANN17979.1 hypothetical protein SD37_21560 [Amycolatopsis orientalis]